MEFVEMFVKKLDKSPLGLETRGKLVHSLFRDCEGQSFSEERWL